MKLKVRLDLGLLRDVFVHHLEKSIFVAAVLFSFVFVFGAVSRERLDFTAADLEGDAKRAREHLREAKPQEYIGRLKKVNYLEEAHRIRTNVQVDPYQYTNLWDPPLFGIPVPAAPQLYTVQALRGDAGCGALTAQANVPAGTAPSPSVALPTAVAAKAATVGQRWIVLTGLIDWNKQAQAYKEAFSGTIVAKTVELAGMKVPGQPLTLEPEYSYVGVQRVEVSDNGNIDPSKWQWIVPKEQMNIANARPGNPQALRGPAAGLPSSDVVDAVFLTRCPWVTFPLAPVLDHRWGPEVAYPPEIPLRVDMLEDLLEEQRRQREEDAKTEKKEEGRKPEKARDPNLPPDDLHVDTAGGAPASAGLMTRNKGMGVGMNLPLNKGLPGTGALPAPTDATALPAAKTAVRLFRFFDFSVEPGKRYRYRVNLVLANPAHGVPSQQAQFLPKELADKQYLVSEWSESSDVVSVPRDSRLLAGSVKSPRSVTAEPIASMMLVHFDGKTGAESSLDESEVLRGQLVNYLQETEFTKPPPESADSGTEKSRGPAASPAREERASRKNNPKVVGIRTTRYHVEDLVLDMVGGNRLSSRDPELTRPGSLLLLDPDGSLIVRNELDDVQSMSRYKPPEPAASAPPGPDASPRGPLRRPPPGRNTRPTR